MTYVKCEPLQFSNPFHLGYSMQILVSGEAKASARLDLLP